MMESIVNKAVPVTANRGEYNVDRIPNPIPDNTIVPSCIASVGMG